MANWLPLDLANVPEMPGVYGFLSGDRWLYVGKAKNLCNRLNRRHPALQVALSLSIAITYWYQVSDERDRLERQLIRELQPEWNGGTVQGELWERRLYAGFGPFCAVPLGDEITFWCGLAELARLHPDRLAYFSAVERQRLMNALPLFSIGVSEEQKQGAIDLL